MLVLVLVLRWCLPPQSPFYVTEEVAALTGLPNNSIVAITTYSKVNRSSPDPYRNTTLNDYFAGDLNYLLNYNIPNIISINTVHMGQRRTAAGIARNWSSPMVVNELPLFPSPVVTVWEDPYLFFDLQRKVWRVLYHEVPGKPNACHITNKSCGNPMPGIHKHCGGHVADDSLYMT